MEPVRALLISTYDLGRQPFGLASPAAWLRRAGLDVTCVDASRDQLEDEQIASASLVGFYLPMHTATRLAAPLIARTRRVNPDARLCAYGLYAPLNEEWLREQGIDDVLGPEAEQGLVELANAGSTPNAQSPTLNCQPPRSNSRGIARLAFIRPDRGGLPPLERYAALLMPDGSRRVAGSTDATRGCKHLCRHCPIVPVYAGQFRVVPVDVVIEDIRAQVAAGAQHVSFGDPDFLNGPAHARRVLDHVAATFPGLSYDVTIKVEHLSRHRDLLPEFRETGCLFITSAVESVDDEVLAKLQKGHTRADFLDVASLCRAAGLTLVPTFVPFTPWTTLEGYVDLLEVIEELDLVEHVAPIQLAIRLLVTSRSALLDLADVREIIEPFDRASLIFPWRHRDARVDALQADIMALVGGHMPPTRGETFAAITALARERAGLPPRPSALRRTPPVPTVSEPWYCCAEPTPQQLGAI
jgi:radical SAM superfamily enzyme YgiQ (UPF0313 family)